MVIILENKINLQTFLPLLRNTNLRYTTTIIQWIFISKTRECENCGKEIIQKKDRWK